MAFCSGCGRQLGVSATVCECGQPVPEQSLATAAGTGAQAAVAPAPVKACPYCGEQILATAVRCKHCQANLGAVAPGAPQPQGISVQGPAMPGNQPTIVIQNVQAQQGPPPPPAWAYREIKNPTIALLLSVVFPGGGQFYNGEAGKGILVLFTFWLAIPYIWSIFDAYNSANRINRTGA